MHPTEAGFDLDALVAEKILGDHRPTYVDENGLNSYLCGSPVKSEGGCWELLYDYEWGDIPEWTPLPFSREISAAWRVVERFVDFNVQLDGHGGNWTFQIFKDATCYEATGATAPLAICLTALKVAEAKAI